MSRITIGIDPGANGAIAWIDERGKSCVEKMPEFMAKNKFLLHHQKKDVFFSKVLSRSYLKIRELKDALCRLSKGLNLMGRCCVSRNLCGVQPPHQGGAYLFSFPSHIYVHRFYFSSHLGDLESKFLLRFFRLTSPFGFSLSKASGFPQTSFLLSTLYRKSLFHLPLKSGKLAKWFVFHTGNNCNTSNKTFALWDCALLFSFRKISHFQLDKELFPCVGRISMSRHSGILLPYA